MSQMHPEREKKYKEWLEEYDVNDPRAVGWVNQEALDKRFRLTVDLLNLPADRSYNHMRFLDYGCGASLNLLKYASIVNYTGVDIREDSLLVASKNHSIPVVESLQYASGLGEKLVTVDNYEKSLRDKKHYFDRIVCQGVYQEFHSIEDVRRSIRQLSTLLSPGGRFVGMTPSNRSVDFSGPAVLRLSMYDLVSALESTGMTYEIYSGKLGEHLAFVVQNDRSQNYEG